MEPAAYESRNIGCSHDTTKAAFGGFCCERYEFMALFEKKDAAKPLPRHIAIIMDGNGRWAQKRGMPRTAGHAAGSETFRRIATSVSYTHLFLSFGTFRVGVRLNGQREGKR